MAVAFEASRLTSARGVSYTRAILVAAVAAIALAISLTNAYAVIYKTVGGFDVSTCDGTVCSVGAQAQKAGIKLGDRVDLRAMPINDRYTDMLYPRSPAPGLRVSFPLERGAKKYAASLVATRDENWPSGFDLLVFLVGKVAAIALAVLVSALFLVRPTPLSGSLALFALGNFCLDPLFYTFLPALAFFVLQLVTALFFAASGAGFLGLALLLGRSPRGSLRRIQTILFIFLATLMVALNAFATLGLPTIALYVAAISIIVVVLAGGCAILIGTALRRSLSTGERVAAALLAVAGLAEALYYAYHLVTLPSLISLPPSVIAALDAVSWAWVFVQMTRFIASAIAAYVIVRDRVVDIGLVSSRILSYGAFVMAVLAAFGLVNWAFATALAAFPYAIPVEIFAALAIGYWFSGFRDVSGALALAAVDAPSAAMNGNRADEQDALARARGLANRTRRPSLIAEIQARSAFSAWVNGDDPAFENYAAAARQALGSQTLRGVRTFVLTATSNDDATVPDPRALPEWLARASLLRCASSDDARHAREHAQNATRRADESGMPWLRVLSRIAVAELVPSERSDRLNEADAIAREIGSLPLAKSLAALRSDKRDLAILQAFVDARLRKIRPGCPAVEISFFSGEVKAAGQTLELPAKERELLFTVAAADKAINGDALCDALWPDSDGDAARNAFYVCLHRLRKRAGDPRIVQRLDQAYVLHPGADVDLWRLEAALAAARSDEVRALSGLLRDGTSTRASLGRWFLPFELRLARVLQEAERFLEREGARRNTHVG